MLRTTTANIKRALRIRIIASEGSKAIFAIAKVKVSGGALHSTGLWTYEWVRGHWDSGHVLGPRWSVMVAGAVRVISP